MGLNMQIRSPRDLGLIIRDKRKKLGLSQTRLAHQVGVGRQWLVAIEQGKATAELGLVLRTLAGLGLYLAVQDSPATSKSDGGPDLDAIVKSARESGH